MPLILSGSAGLSGNVGTTTKEMLPAGSVIQVVQTAYSAADAVSSSTPQNTGCVASITPLSATSKILVVASIPLYHLAAALNAFARISRNSGAAVSGKFHDFYTGGGSGICGNVGINWLDSPGSTAPVVYTVQIGSDPAGAVHMNKDFNGVNNGVTYLTLLEVKA